ncbi:protein NUCLEAR FUSION DEFECTIVE 6, mitochondrial-like isoform X3 [Rhododendron vialii]|uniref:protein NUCLEAR FUSION DEFECTIVE 6, mitochondrial-like isoform X3 n=1 Tax=Rhododendron vialii TaxID=182163 RepID=UPI00265DC01A|nr:protein NUCLEAR FUSION DEFECTIVE 6, mitochondrial-like isoform X3 [Rhododendron vialii]XP_058217206.1 protein NUCLEAR FUSION DEFECTIVE 6, mitochondrial-like isoform X3 [Rhododendron vialii]
MASAAAARCVFRSNAVRNVAARVASEAKAARSSPFRVSSRSPLSHRIFRCPAEMSVFAGSMQPFHTATASALMTSMLSISRCGYGWLPEGLILNKTSCSLRQWAEN